MHYSNHSTKIYVYAMPVLDSRMYILPNNRDESEALIIDPVIREEAVPVLEKFTRAAVLLTHSHYDHISGVNWLRGLTDVTLLCSEQCAANITDPHKNLAAFSHVLVIDKSPELQKQAEEYFDLSYTCKADKIFDTETSFPFGDYLVTVTHTPGHSECSQCITLTSSFPDLTPKIVFTGDSLVNGHPVITRLPGGSKKSYRQKTAPFLDAIENDTIIMPGHGEWGMKKEMICS